MTAAVKNLRIFLTGATGFAGGQIARSLLQHGAQVTAWLHQHELPQELAACTALPSHDLAKVRDAILNCDAVCHAAAFVPPQLEDPQFARQCIEANALLTLELAQAAARNPKIRFVYFSLGQGYVVRGRAAKESDPLYPSARAPFYLGSKLLGEIYLENLRRQKNLQSSSLRIGSIYGSGMRHTSAPAVFMENARRNQTLRVHHGGTPACDFVHVSDVVHVALSALAGTGAPGIYNVGSGHASSLLELAQATVEVFGSSSKIEVEPAQGKPPESFAALDTSKAAAAFGYQPLDLRAGLEKEKRRMAVSA